MHKYICVKSVYTDVDLLHLKFLLLTCFWCLSKQRDIKKSGNNFLLYFLSGLYSQFFSLAHLITAVVSTYHQYTDDFPFCVSRAPSSFKLSHPTVYWTSLDHSAFASKSACPSPPIFCLTSPCVPCFMHTWYLIHSFIQQILTDYKLFT